MARRVALIGPAATDELSGQLTQPRYEYGYDGQGNQTLIRDPLQRETLFTYDAQGHQLTRTLPEEEEEERQYDTQGRLALEVSFEGVVTAYVYADTAGSAGRLLQRRYFESLTAYNEGQGTPSEIAKYTCDAFGRQTEVIQDRDGNLTTTSDQRVTTNAYDSQQGRLTSVVSPEGTIHYEYDPVTGQQVRTWTGTSSSDPDTDTRYDYDPLGRLDAVRAVARNGEAITPEVTDYVYDLLGNLDQVRLPNDVVSDYDYDSLNRLELLRQFHDENDNHTYEASVDTVLAEFDYDLSADGRRSGVTEKDDQGHTTRIDWLYDDAGRLTRESYNSYDNGLDFIAQYTFDLVGNRVAKDTDTDPTFSGNPTFDETVTYTYDANDRLLTETKDAAGTANDRHTVYAYGTGNAGTQQSGKTVYEGLDSGGTKLTDTKYTYNLQGRMSKAEIDSDGNGTVDHTSEYEYDDSGIRVSQTVDGEKTVYLVDYQNPTGYAQVLEELSATGALLQSYTLGLDVISQALASGAVRFLLYDGHGSTRGLVDATGQPLSGQVYRYDAYGNPIGFDPANALTALLYSGELTDGLTGLQYLRARYYDCATGRFTRLDPFFGRLADPLSLHKYLYTHGNPVNGVDPTGLEMSLAGQLAVTSIVGGLFGMLANGLSNYAAGRPIFEGMARAYLAGALLAPLALLCPAFGVGLSIWGLATSVPFAIRVAGDPESSTGQTTAAIALAALAVLGTRTAVQNVRANGFWYNRSLFPGNSSRSTLPAVSDSLEIAELNAQLAQGAPPRVPTVPRTTADQNIHATHPNPPPASTSSSIGNTPSHNTALQNFLRVLTRDPDVSDIRVNQHQVNAAGTRVGINRPDLQFARLNNETGVRDRFYIEWDRIDSNRGLAHAARSLANDNDGIPICFQFGPP